MSVIWDPNELVQNIDWVEPAAQPDDWPCCDHCDPSLSEPGETHSAPCPECQDYRSPDSAHYCYELGT